MRGDFRQCGPTDHLIWDTETLRLRRKPANGGFPRNICSEFCRARTGWRSSADGPLLCLYFLLTGNFTGLPIRIPYSTEQGILAREQGILSAGIEIIVG